MTHKGDWAERRPSVRPSVLHIKAEDFSSMSEQVFVSSSTCLFRSEAISVYVGLGCAIITNISLNMFPEERERMSHFVWDQADIRKSWSEARKKEDWCSLKTRKTGLKEKENIGENDRDIQWIGHLNEHLVIFEWPGTLRQGSLADEYSCMIITI